MQLLPEITRKYRAILLFIYFYVLGKKNQVARPGVSEHLWSMEAAGALLHILALCGWKLQKENAAFLEFRDPHRQGSLL